MIFKIRLQRYDFFWNYQKKAVTLRPNCLIMGKKGKKYVDDLPLIAVELGSDAIRAMAARLTEEDGDERLQILGYEETRRFKCVKEGLVVNSSNAGFMIKEVLQLLANRIGFDENFPTAFTLLGGNGMKLYRVSSKRDQVQKQPVSDHLLEQIAEDCRNNIENKNPNYTVIGLFPYEYLLDGTSYPDIPAGTRARLVEVRFCCFIGEKAMRSKVQASFDHSYKSIEQAYCRADALLSVFATDDETILDGGCALIDLGAETTTMAIYLGNEYKELEVVNKGGSHITQAIMEVVPNMELAEKIKCNYGMASPEMVEENRIMNIKTGNGILQVGTRQLAELIQRTLDQCLDKPLEIINRYADQLSCLYITGGGCLLSGLADYIQSRTRVAVNYGYHSAILVDSTDNEYNNPKYSSLIGALYLGAADRHNAPLTVVKKPFVEKLIDELEIIFTDAQ